MTKMLRLLRAVLLALLPVHTALAAPLTVAVGLAKPPYVEAEAKGGLEVELVETALRRAGMEPRLLPMPPARALADLAVGRIDAMTSLGPQADSALFYSQPVVQYVNKAITLARQDITLRGLPDLARYRVAAFQNASRLLGREFEGLARQLPQYTEYADQATQLRLLYRGRVDVVLLDINIFRALRAQEKLPDEVAQPLRVFDLFPPLPRHVGFYRVTDRDAFDRAFSGMVRDGTVRQILQRYRQQGRYDF